MKFSMSYEIANLLYKFAKAHCAKPNAHPDYSRIACDIQDESLVATMLNGIRGAMIRLPIFEIEPDTTQTVFIIPPAKSFKKSDNIITVVDSPLQTEYRTAVRSEVYNKPTAATGRKFDLARLLNDAPKFSIWCDPKNLADSLSAFDGTERIRLDFISTNQGMYLTSENAQCKAIVIPMKPPKGGL